MTLFHHPVSWLRRRSLAGADPGREVATDTGGIAEVISTGESGWLVPVGDVAAAAGAVTRLAADPSLRRRLAADARRRLNGAFDIGAMLRALERDYDELLRATDVSHLGESPSSH